MNRPPEQFVRLPHQLLRDFTFQALLSVGMEEEQAGLLSDLLVTNDLRGVFSHGTRLTIHYVRQMKRGEINPRPTIRIVSETRTTLRLDGDGGLGYFPAYQAAEWVAERTRQEGVAAAVTGHHGHIGAAGIYARIPLRYHLMTFVTSGHQLRLEPGGPLLAAAGGSPIAFAVPALYRPPIVVDFAVTGELSEAIYQMAPGIFFRSLGLGAICQTVGGFLSGLPARPSGSLSRFAGATQGAFIMSVDPSRFLPMEQFLSTVDDYLQQVDQLKPMPGFEKAYLAGGIEWEREQRWRQEGIPIGPEHLSSLKDLARETSTRPPF
ncbi:MAG: Ldh family oxidoreductase [Armatimonadetes bacterium]|nr:Ldh family oxidoreductase [Armatimonadota bacterium]MDW8122526.1 Ldh family oxidoreductase [Armatimonadota bacterium]